MFIQDHEILQETATRLIKAMGVETAISVCRSNYWHGVLQLILEQHAKNNGQTVDRASTDRLYNSPQAANDHHAETADKAIIAA